MQQPFDTHESFRALQRCRAVFMLNLVPIPPYSPRPLLSVFPLATSPFATTTMSRKRRSSSVASNSSTSGTKGPGLGSSASQPGQTSKRPKSETVLAGLASALEIAENVLDGFPIPAAKFVIKGVLKFVDNAKVLVVFHPSQEESDQIASSDILLKQGHVGEAEQPCERFSQSCAGTALWKG